LYTLYYQEWWAVCSSNCYIQNLINAVSRIGELSRELETAERARTDLHPNDRKQTKEQALADAGISTSTAHDYEQQLAGDPSHIL
jgi:hypothetical protein